MMMSTTLPKIVSQEEWQVEREKLLVKEKAYTRAMDALAAERRRLPMVKIEKHYVFEGKDGSVSFLDLFEGRRQLILYHFMMAPGAAPCVGCSSFADNIGHLAHLHARNTSLVMVSRAPLAEIESFKKRMGWTLPWVSSNGSDFNYDFGASTDRGEVPGVSVFLRDGDNIYHTYYTTARGTDRLGFVNNLLDLTPFGRQETWEDSPEGWPQSPPYQWWRLHDEYDA